jgi:hypothetical protein
MRFRSPGHRFGGRRKTYSFTLMKPTKKIMKPIRIFGVGKSDTHSYFVLEKKQEFIPAFRQLLVEMGVGDAGTVEIYSFGAFCDDAGEPTNEDESIKNLTDKHYYFKSRKLFQRCQIDVVIGKDRIFVIFVTTSDHQAKIMDAMSKFAHL